VPCIADGQCASHACQSAAGQLGRCLLPSGAYCRAAGDCAGNVCEPSPIFGKCQ
jgi:hypothetical protein